MTKILITLICSLASGASLATQYFCVADSAVGYWYNLEEEKWQPTEFTSDLSKYVVSPNNHSTPEFEVQKVGEQFPVSECEQDFNRKGYLFCSGPKGVRFKMNRYNMRYIVSFTEGYFNVAPGGVQSDDKSFSPYVEIGKCTKWRK